MLFHAVSGTKEGTVLAESIQSNSSDAGAGSTLDARECSNVLGL